MLLLALAGRQEDYYPLAEGCAWSSRATVPRANQQKQELPASMRVMGKKKVKDVDCFVVENEVAGVASREYVAADSGGVKVYGGSQHGVEFVYDKPILRLKYPLQAGASWQDRAGEGGAVVEYKTTVAGEEEVEVPAGKFKAFKLKIETTSPAGRVEAYNWHARGVGIVKQSLKHSGPRGDLEITIELKSFTREKK